MEMQLLFYTQLSAAQNKPIGIVWGNNGCVLWQL